MLEQTDNDLPKANEDNVSKNASLPNTPKEDDAVADMDTSSPKKTEIIKVEDAKLEPIPQENTASEKKDALGKEAGKETDVENAEEEHDFGGMSPKEMVSFFSEALRSKPIHTLRQTIDSLTKAFEKEMTTLKEAERKAFIETGGNPDAFYFNPTVKKEFNDLIRRYKSDKGTYYRSIEEKQKYNLAQRLTLIEELKGLINMEQDINTTYQQFKDLQQRWKETGQVPRMEANNVWKTYHHHVGHFYDFLHLNRELRELDFKFNLEQKLRICEQAEALASMEDIPKAFRHLQTLHKKWKDELGPVDKEHSEQVWERFSEATKIIHDKRRYFIKNQEEIFEENLAKKRALITQLEELVAKEFSNKTNINNLNKTYDGLRDAFFAVGRVPEKKRNDLWASFKKASNQYSKKRNRYYKILKKEYGANAAKRKELIAQVEALKNETNYRETTPKIIALQKEWRTAGPVKKEDFITLNNQFKTVCNEYFDNKDASRNKANTEQKENLKQKSSLLNALNEHLLSKEELNATTIDDIVSQWNAIGYIPRNKMKINQEFSTLVDKAYKEAGLSSTEITQKSYQQKLDNIRKDDDSIRKEVHSLNRRIEEVKQEIIQLETNLQFFGKNQENNPIVIKVRQDIQNHEERLEKLQDKKRLVKSLHKD